MKWLWAWLVSFFTAANPGVSSMSSPLPPYQRIGEYYYEQAVVEDVARIKLSSNLSTSQKSVDFFEQNDCQFLVNAGFYDTENKHLGWFQADGRELNPPQANRLLDGYLTFNDWANIGFEPEAGTAYGIQSGPVLIYESQPLGLKIKDDQRRRRVVAAIDSSGKLNFYVLFSPESDYAGPLLADLPRIILELNPAIVAAINLDGGSASAFITDKVKLIEYQPAGGFFCYTKL